MASLSLHQSQQSRSGEFPGQGRTGGPAVDTPGASSRMRATLRPGHVRPHLHPRCPAPRQALRGCLGRVLMNCLTQWYKGQIESALGTLQKPTPTRVGSAGMHSPVSDTFPGLLSQESPGRAGGGERLRALCTYLIMLPTSQRPLSPALWGCAICV